MKSEKIFEGERSIVFSKMRKFIKNLPDEKELIKSNLTVIKENTKFNEIIKIVLTISDKKENNV